MYPRSFRISGQMNRYDRTIQLDHILFQFDIVALGIPPIKICLSVVVNKNSRIDIFPRDLGKFGRHIIGDQCGTTGIHKRTDRRIRYGYTDGFSVNSAVFHRHIPIELPVTFYHLTSPCFPFCPTEIFGFQRNWMLRPCLHIGRREYTPFIQLVMFSGRRTFIMSGINVHLTVMHHSTRIGCIFIFYDGIAIGYKSSVILRRQPGKGCQCA